MTEAKADDAVLGGNSGACATPKIAKPNMVLGVVHRCKHPDHIKFCQEMTAAGIPVEFSIQRFNWEGPTVRCKDISEVIKLPTTVSCVYDNLGWGFKIYPKIYCGESWMKLVELYEKDPQRTKQELAMHLRLGEPIRTLAQNAIEHLRVFVIDN